MDVDDITFEEAEARLQAESRKHFEKELHPDGKEIALHVWDFQRLGRNLPNVNIRLWANGTWEFVE